MFDITSISADSSNIARHLGWTYTTATGSIGGTHTLLMPEGKKDITKATKADLVGWLKEQIGNTEEELAAGIEANSGVVEEHDVPVRA